MVIGGETLQTISIYQKIARVWIVMMLAGALVLVIFRAAVMLAYGENMGLFHLQNDEPAAPEWLRGMGAAASAVSVFSFLLGEFGVYAGSNPLLYLLPRPAAIVITSVLLAAVTVLLAVLSRYLVRTKGARTASAVFLGVILADLPLTLHGWSAADLNDPPELFHRSGWTAAASIAVHIAAAVLLLLALRHMYRQREHYTDFFPPKRMMLTDIQSEKIPPQAASEPNSAGVYQSGARILVVIMCISTLILLISPVAALLSRIGLIGGTSAELWKTDATVGGLFSFTLYLLGKVMLYQVDNAAADIFCIMLSLFLVAMLLWAQRYFTRSHWLTKPMMLMTLTFVAIDTVPFLSIGGFAILGGFLVIPNVLLHVLLAGMLIYGIRKQ